MGENRIVGPEVAFIGSPECVQEAASLLAYCEKNFPVGESTQRQKSVTGENYTELCRIGECLSAAGAREHAQDHFDRYSKGRKGTLYWRIVPEIAFTPKKAKYGYYMRLLISDKPRVGDA
jgi:hypothetical protein